METMQVSHSAKKSGLLLHNPWNMAPIPCLSDLHNDYSTAYEPYNSRHVKTFRTVDMFQFFDMFGASGDN